VRRVSVPRVYVPKRPRNTAERYKPCPTLDHLAGFPPRCTCTKQSRLYTSFRRGCYKECGHMNITMSWCDCRAFCYRQVHIPFYDLPFFHSDRITCLNVSFTATLLTPCVSKNGLMLISLAGFFQSLKDSAYSLVPCKRKEATASDAPSLEYALNRRAVNKLTI
jgi:hypothetical protein